VIDLIAFDLDGTLIETAAEIAATVNDVLRHEHLPELPETLFRTWIGNGTRATLAAAHSFSVASSVGGTVPEQPPEPLLLDRLMRLYGQYHATRCATRSSVLPEVRRTLELLRGRGVILTVVTNKEAWFACELLSRHQLSEFFVQVVGGDTLPRRKPHPAPLLHCLATHRVPPERALMVGDSHIDLRAARAANVRCVLLRRGYGTATGDSEVRPDAAIDSFAEILSYVANTEPELVNT
jgi:phosphoglycolate phosphatase